MGRNRAGFCSAGSDVHLRDRRDVTRHINKLKSNTTSDLLMYVGNPGRCMHAGYL